MRKTLAIILFAATMLFGVTPASAEESRTDQAEPLVIDESGHLTPTELIEVQSSLDAAYESKGVIFVVEFIGTTAELSIDDFLRFRAVELDIHDGRLRNGVFVVIALEDQTFNHGIGPDLGAVTDEYAGQTIDNVLVEYLSMDQVAFSVMEAARKYSELVPKGFNGTESEADISARAAAEAEANRPFISKALSFGAQTAESIATATGVPSYTVVLGIVLVGFLLMVAIIVLIIVGIVRRSKRRRAAAALNLAP